MSKGTWLDPKDPWDKKKLSFALARIRKAIDKALAEHRRCAEAQRLAPLPAGFPPIESEDEAVMLVLNFNWATLAMGVTGAPGTLSEIDYDELKTALAADQSADG